MTEKVYSQADLIGMTIKLLNQGRPEYTKISREFVEQIIRAYEHTITDTLKEAAAPDTEITVKAFNGLKIIATYVPERIINLYGEERAVKAKVSTKARVSKYFNYCAVNGNTGMGRLHS